MGDYNAFRPGGGDIEMNAGAERIRTNNTSTTSGTSSANEFTKTEPSSEDDDGPETDYQPINWKRLLFTPKYIVLWIVLIIIGVLTAVITLKHDQVVAALRPFAEKVRDITAGWLIFVAVLFVISFPPLFGHELVALLAGVVYGLWIGFAVVAAGTFIGEIGTWFAFKRFLRKKAEKMERTNLTYGAMAKMCRDGGFWIVFVIRLSIVPSHMSTAVFSTCDVKFWYFAVSTFFTLPKQLILVYLGVLLVGGQSDFLVKFALFGVAGVVTVGAGVWIWYKMINIKKDLLAKQEQRKAKRALARNNSYHSSDVQGATNEQQANGRAWQPQDDDMSNAYAAQTSSPVVGGTAWQQQHQDNDMGSDTYGSSTYAVQQSPPTYEAYRPRTAQNPAYAADGFTPYRAGSYRAEEADLGTYGGRYEYPETYNSPPRTKPEETRDFI